MSWFRKLKEIFKKDELGPENVLTKLERDHWGNLVVLKGGSWFICSHIIQTYNFNGTRWIEFQINLEGCEEFVISYLKPCKNLRLLEMRNIAINSWEIAYIGEFDG